MRRRGIALEPLYIRLLERPEKVSGRSRGARPRRAPRTHGNRRAPARFAQNEGRHEHREHDEASRRLREELAVHLPRFSFSPEGLLRAARTVATGEPVASEAEAPLPPVEALEEHLWRWAACAALVPDPTWQQLEAVRRDLDPLASALPDPRLVQRLIEWAAREGLAIDGKSYHLGGGPRLAFDKARRGLLLRRLSEHDARAAASTQDKLAWRARDLLVSQLEAANLGDDPFGEALRLAKIAFHRAVMHPEQAQELLAEHTEGAVGREIKELTLEELELQAGGANLAGAWDPEFAETARAYATGASDARLGDLVRLRAGGWRVHGWVLPWGLVGLAGALLWWGAGLDPLVDKAVAADRDRALGRAGRGVVVGIAVVTLLAVGRLDDGVAADVEVRVLLGAGSGDGAEDESTEDDPEPGVHRWERMRVIGDGQGVGSPLFGANGATSAICPVLRGAAVGCGRLRSAGLEEHGEISIVVMRIRKSMRCCRGSGRAGAASLGPKST